ncbi:hypothetical protein ACFW96_24290 [Streptomyces gardneri]|uniref:hypothetical protein n=1 Tax=Streptomyces gardneri TaxID=66892 RepID=UPI0036A25A62
MEPAFHVDQNRVITLFGPTMVETAVLVGLAMHRVRDVWPPDPAERRGGPDRLGGVPRDRRRRRAHLVLPG